MAKNAKQMRNLHVYISRHRFYGYPDEHANLKFYSPEEVTEAVEEVFGSNNTENPTVFIDPSITQHTNLLIVPDHWNKRIPETAMKYRSQLDYIPFAYVLHANQPPAKIQQLTAPPNADLVYELQRQNKMEHMLPTAQKTRFFEMDSKTHDEISNLIAKYRQHSQWSGATESMATTHEKPRQREHSLSRRRSSIYDKSRHDKQEEQTQIPSWHAHMNDMIARKIESNNQELSDLSPENGLQAQNEKAEQEAHDAAWSKLKARAASMTY